MTRAGDRDLRRGSAAALAGRNGGIGGAYGAGGVRRDIDRIFEGGDGEREECFVVVFAVVVVVFLLLLFLFLFSFSFCCSYDF